MKNKDREILGPLIDNALNSVFQHGMSHQRFLDAQVEVQVDSKHAHSAMQELHNFLMIPDKKEMN